MKYENYYNICDLAQKIYEYDPALNPGNNMSENTKNRLRECSVIDERFNALFYYEYVMYLIRPNFNV